MDAHPDLGCLRDASAIKAPRILYDFLDESEYGIRVDLAVSFEGPFIKNNVVETNFDQICSRCAMTSPSVLIQRER